MLIMTYYSVIGGWITKYFFEYLTTSGRNVAEDGYFTSFITEKNAPLIFTGIFLALTIWVVYRGVEKGIEKFSCFIMPGLILLVIGIAIFSLTISYTDADGTVRTGIQGFLVYVRPDFTGLTVKGFLEDPHIRQSRDGAGYHDPHKQRHAVHPDGFSEYNQHIFR